MPSHSNDGARLAVDIGGTFTDVVLEAGARRWISKVLTTPQAPEQGFLRGVKTVLDKAGMTPAQVGLVLHGTTLGTNALIERKGARTAFLTTAGFRDVLEIGYEHRYELYDLSIVKPEPLVPRQWRFTVPERVAADGTVLRELDTDALVELVPRLRSEGIESLAIGFLQSYANDKHERQARDVLARALPALSISISSEVSPEIREYDRFSTVCANAYIRPVMDAYLARLEIALADGGFGCPLFLMSSGGTLTSPGVARQLPVRLVESGPAGGAILAAGLAREQGIARLMAFDMGGTTAKICFIDDGRPQTSRIFEAARVYRFAQGSGLPLRIPVIELVEIGAGGGSIARIDEVGRLAIGPDSAGSEPGPACYGRGGTQPTVTDADLVAGRLDASKFASELSVDRAAAERALTGIGGRFGWSVDQSALAIAETVEENMASAARIHAVEGGRDVAACTMVAFGGAAPMHAARVAQKLGIRRLLIPTGAGVGSAVGFLRAPVAFESSETWIQRTLSLDVTQANERIERQMARCRSLLPGAQAALQEESLSVTMRYTGQGYEIEVPLPAPRLDADAPQTISGRFDAAYARLYGRAIDGLGHEIVGWNVRVEVVQEKSGFAPQVEAGTGTAVPASTQDHVDHMTATRAPLTLHQRESVTPERSVTGPALVAEAETTTFVPAGWRALCAPDGNLWLLAEGELL